MRKLTVDDIVDHRAYERERDEFRASVIAMKKRRRIALGDFLLLAVEHHGDRARVEHERQQVERRDDRKPPARRHQRRHDRAEALPCEQRDEQPAADRQQDHGSTRHTPSPLALRRANWLNT